MLQVTNITIGGPVHADYNFASVVGSGEQLRTVPIGGMDIVSLKFSEEVLATKSALGTDRATGPNNSWRDRRQFYLRRDADGHLAVQQCLARRAVFAQAQRFDLRLGSRCTRRRI